MSAAPAREAAPGDAPRLTLTEDQYFDIEDALAATPRGRAFLRMRDQRSRVVATSEVRRIGLLIRDWTTARLATADGETCANALRHELQEMSAYIDKTRSEIAAMRRRDAKDGDSRFDTATGELGAIVTSTEHATSDILNAAERILALARRLPPDLAAVANEIVGHATDIMTHCSFQDLTGQRITKVVNTLCYLEQRVHAMVEIWGVDDSTRSTVAAAAADARPDAHLLHGPARPGHGRTQQEIDALLAETFGTSAAAVVSEPRRSEAARRDTDQATIPTVGQADIDKLFA